MRNPPFSFKKAKDSTGFLLWQTTISWQRLIKKALEPYSISHAQFVIMAILLWLQGQKQEISQIDIVEMSKLDKMTISKSLKKLSCLNFVQRIEHSKDTRAKAVVLTKSGITLANKLVPMIEKIDAKFFSKIDNNQEKDLVTILQKLTTKI